MQIIPIKSSENLTSRTKISFKNKNYKEYLLKTQKALKNTPRENWTLQDFNMNSLEGIQNGLKILGNLTMKQIKLLANLKTLNIITKRGCNNMCAHCYVNAKPESYYRNQNTISKIDFEDFKNLCDDISSLDERMGFNIFNEKDKNSTIYHTLFYDSDSSMIYSVDKNGKEYDYLDLSEMLNKASGAKIVFDTSGWNIQDKKTQERMEKLVKKYIENPEKYNFMQFNISINPFHTLYYHSVLKEKEGNKQLAEKLRDIYTTRMANVIYTLSPIMIKQPESYGIIARSFKDSTSKKTAKFQKNDTIELGVEILNKAILMLEKDLDTNKQNVKSIEDIENICNEFLLYLYNVSDNLIYTGRLLERFGNNKLDTKFLKKQSKNQIIKNAKKYKGGIIDLNGKFYLTNYKEIFPTNIQLNYSTKNKSTAPIYPNLNEEIINI